MSPATPCPACGSDVTSASGGAGLLLHCPSCETDFVPAGETSEVESAEKEPFESAESEMLPESLAPASPANPSAAIWRWAEDGGPFDGPVSVPIQMSPSTAAVSP